MYSFFRRNPEKKEIRHYWTDEEIIPKRGRGLPIKHPSNSYLIYEGPSLYDGEAIVAIATGFIKPSVNPKTGPMIQIVIMRADIHPQEAIWSGEDKSVCGKCDHLGEIIKVPKEEYLEHRTAESSLSSKRSCYVQMQHVYSIWNKYRREGNNYPRLNFDQIAEMFRLAAYPPRFGDYGDPAMVPLKIWKEVVKYRDKWTGYTSQWRLKRAQSYKPYLQASVNTYDEYKEANEMGWRTYRTGRRDEPLIPGEEMYCPETPEGGMITHCGECALCMGTSRQGLNILTRPTGKGAHFHEDRDFRRHNPYHRNPGEAKAMKTINGILGDLTPCDKKAWGLSRRARYMQRRRFHSRRNPYQYNPSDEDKAMKTINGILGDLTPCDKKAWGLAHYRNRRNFRNRRHFRNHRRFRHNPTSESQALKTINSTLKNLTPCDKKDWGLARYHRNPRGFRNHLYY